MTFFLIFNKFQIICCGFLYGDLSRLMDHVSLGILSYVEAKTCYIAFFFNKFRCKMFISFFFFNDSSFLNDLQVGARKLIRKKYIEKALSIHTEVFNTLYVFMLNYMLASPKNNNQPK